MIEEKGARTDGTTVKRARKPSKRRRKRSVLRAIMIVNIVIASMEAFYLANVFFDVPFFGELRNLWIETAMTTADHQWLATSFFPRSLVDRVMSAQVITGEGEVSDPNLIRPGRPSSSTGNGSGSGSGSGSGFGTGGNGMGLSGDNAFMDDDGSSAGGGAGFGSGASGTGAGTGTGSGAGSYGSGGRYNSGQSLSSGSRLGAAEGEGFEYADGRVDGSGAYGSSGGAYGSDGAQGINGSYGAGFGANGVYGANGSGSYDYEPVGPQPWLMLPDPDGVDWAGGAPVLGDKDANGNEIIALNTDEDLVVVEVRGTGYVGRVLFVSDPSRVVVRHTSRKEVRGDFIKDYLEEHNAAAGINGNGFFDPEGHGKGGEIIGWSVSDGVAWGGGAKTAYASVGLNSDDVLVVGTIKNFDDYNIRDLAQFGPTLIINGEKQINGSGGWGLQPRTAIGQRPDGSMLLATFDGRSTHSVGITAGQVADIFAKYGCVNAGLCDGGSSSIMMYEGEILGVPSTPMKDTGRYLPNAFLVLRLSEQNGGENAASDPAALGGVGAERTADGADRAAVAENSAAAADASENSERYGG